MRRCDKDRRKEGIEEDVRSSNRAHRRASTLFGPLRANFAEESMWALKVVFNVQAEQIAKFKPNSVDH